MFYLATLVFSSSARFSYLSLPIFYFSKMVSQYQCFRYHYLCKPSIFKLWFALNVSEENETICGGKKMKPFVHGGLLNVSENDLKSIFVSRSTKWEVQARKWNDKNIKMKTKKKQKW